MNLKKQVLVKILTKYGCAIVTGYKFAGYRFIFNNL